MREPDEDEEKTQGHIIIVEKAADTWIPMIAPRDLPSSLLAQALEISPQIRKISTSSSFWLNEPLFLAAGAMFAGIC